MRTKAKKKKERKKAKGIRWVAMKDEKRKGRKEDL